MQQYEVADDAMSLKKAGGRSCGLKRNFCLLLHTQPRSVLQPSLIDCELVA